MKSLIFLILFAPTLAQAAETAGYYRLWQGFKRADITQSQFQRELPPFMHSTLNLYRDDLNQYLVVVPPSHKPHFVPDEFALVAIGAEENYRRIRNTDEGRKYAESHWQLFARETSSSAPYTSYFPARPEALEHNKAYDLVGTPVDWASGHTTFFLGLRKSGVSSSDFLRRLSRHVALAAESFRGQGLRGYLVIANENYEAAYLNWESREAMVSAFGSREGLRAQEDAAALFDMLQWTEAEAFDGRIVRAGRLYSTKSR